MAKSDNIEIRSDEVQEIMGTPPKWIIRRGITIILLVVVVLVVGSYFYKYPDLIEARVTIVSENPPVSVVARSEGKLDQLFVNDKQKVAATSILGIIENPANYKDVYALLEVLDTVQGYFASPLLFKEYRFSRQYSIGQYQAYYSSFISQLRDYQTFLSYNSYAQRVLSLEKQLVDYRAYMEQLKAQALLLQQDYDLAYRQFLRDSVLCSKKVMAELDFENSKASLLKQKYTCQDAFTDVASTRITMNQLVQQVQEQNVSKTEMGKKLLTVLKERFDNLFNQLKLWEQTYVLKTPIAGNVTFTNFWSVNQFVSAGDIVFSVVPENDQKIIVKAILPVLGAGKVEIGQRVNVKLDNYPYMEYGILEGEVVNISMVPVVTEQGSYYTAEIMLKDKLMTNYKKDLPFNQGMQGVGEVITKDRRLIERLIQPLLSILREKV